jgi:hypothetical protein
MSNAAPNEDAVLRVIDELYETLDIEDIERMIEGTDKTVAVVLREIAVGRLSGT